MSAETAEKDVCEGPLSGGLIIGYNKEGCLERRKWVREMTNRDILTNELEATTRSLQHRASDLHRHSSKLQLMVNGPSEEREKQYQVSLWTGGEVARCVAEIASLLSRQQTLQDTLRLLTTTQKDA